MSSRQSPEQTRILKWELWCKSTGKAGEWAEKAKQFSARVVDSGPVFENIEEGDRVDLSKFPVPMWHEEDGGEYIGTGVGIVTRDPDTDQVNIGTYRVQRHNKNTVGFYISPGKHEMN